MISEESYCEFLPSYMYRFHQECRYDTRTWLLSWPRQFLGFDMSAFVRDYRFSTRRNVIAVNFSPDIFIIGLRDCAFKRNLGKKLTRPEIGI